MTSAPRTSGATFTVDDLNAFFIENLGPKGRLTELLPKGFHSPRVAIDGDRLKIGVKYGEGFWSTVVWLELKVWLVADQTNMAAVEVCSLKAGGLPFGSQTILDKIADVARDSSIDVTWYRNKSNPVGVFRFFSKQPQATSQVLTLDVKDGRIMVAGRSFQERSRSTPAEGGNPEAGRDVGNTQASSDPPENGTAGEFGAAKFDLRAVGFIRVPLAGAGVPSRHAPAPAGHRAFVVEVEEAVRCIQLGGNVCVRHRLREQPPRPKNAVRFRQEIPVRLRPVVGEDDESWHGR